MAKITLPNSQEMVTFELLKRSMSQHVGCTTLKSFEAHRETLPHLDGMVYTFSANLLAKKIHRDSYKASFSYQTPASWWQMLKETKAPQWFVKRWPVAYTSHTMRKTVKFTRYNTYPMADVSIPKNERFISMLGEPVLWDEVTCD
jgi:hypothetical protein